MEKLTEMQRKVLEYLKESSSMGVPPSVREIAAELGISSTSTVHMHLKALETMGYIKRGEGKKRCITITGYSATTQVPILGTVTAGIPIYAFEEVLGYLPYPNEKSRELFALKIKGLSMKDVGIMDGDYIIAEKIVTANNGDIVVALIEDEATVKTFYNENGTVRLQPENDDFEPIYPEHMEILGKVIAQTRYYE